MPFLNPFPNRFLSAADCIGRKLMRPSFFFADSVACCFIVPSPDPVHPILRCLQRLLLSPLLFSAFIICLSSAILGFSIWFLTSFTRVQNFSFSYRPNKEFPAPEYKKKYTFATSNTCLLLETYARVDNVVGNKHRARGIGKSIVDSQQRVLLSQMSKMKTNGREWELSKPLQTPIEDQNGSNMCDNEMTFNHDISTKFPLVDVWLFQETFDSACYDLLIEELHRVYPYIVYDATHDSLRNNMYFNNSGLMVASRYPVTDAKFSHFTNSIGACRLSSQGCLNVKVLLGESTEGERVVGYINNTHLQPYKGNTSVQREQLDCLQMWCKEFRENTHKSNERIAFDILAGDFNFDNMSPADRSEFSHPVFQEYRDVCRVRPGLDHTWAVGTEHRYTPFHDTQIATPAGLKEALEDPDMRQYYFHDADNEAPLTEMRRAMPSVGEGRDIPNPVGGKRRIDNLLYRNGDGNTIEEFLCVTQLAGLTDHIPLSMTLRSSS